MKHPKKQGFYNHLCLFALLGALAFLAGLPESRATISMESAVHVPTSGWLVGPASMAPAAADEKMPCLMANQYDNGYTLRFSGGGDKIMAIAIDFREAAFNPGDTYTVNVSVKDKFSKVYEGLAYNGSTLIVNTLGSEELYHSLGDSKILAFGLNGSLFEFAMLGVRDGLKRVETCYAPDSMQKTLAPVNAGAGNAAGHSLRNTGRDVSFSAPADASAGPSGEPVVPSGKVAGEAASPMNNLAYPQQELLPLPAADAGSSGDEGAAAGDLTVMLNKAASRLYEPQAEMAGQAAPAVKTNTPEVSGQAEGQPVVTSAPKALGMAPATARRPDILVPRSHEAPPGAAQEEAPDIRHWRAIKGANLREVLDVWTQGTSRELAWMADREFPVEKSITLKGTFESAVRTLLEQYNGQAERPVGRIYQDPGQNKQILMIQTAN